MIYSASFKFVIRQNRLYLDTEYPINIFGSHLFVPITALPIMYELPTYSSIIRCTYEL